MIARGIATWEVVMFRGINAVNIDVKGRIAIPMRYRQCLCDEFDGQLVLTIDTEQRCLLMYPFSVWEEIEKKITALPSFHPETRRIQRLLIGHATEIALDSHGRILLLPLLREYAGLDKRVILLGQGNKFEIWDEHMWGTCRDAWLKEKLIKGDLPDDIKTISL